MDYLRRLNAERDFSESQLFGSLQTLQSCIVCDSSGSFERKNQIILDLFQIASETNAKMAPEQWDKIRFNIYCFIAAMSPKQHLIPEINIPVTSSYGPLFYIITLLLTQRQSNDGQIETLTKYYNRFINSIIQAKTTENDFYTRSELAYSHYVPILLVKASSRAVEDLFPQIFQVIKQRNDNYRKNATSDRIIFTFQAYQFIFDFVKYMKVRNAKKQFTEAGTLMMLSLRFCAPVSSVLIPNYFSFVQVFLGNDFAAQMNTTKAEEIGKIAELFFYNSRLRVNDMFKPLQNSGIFDFFDKLESPKSVIQMMHFISQLFTQGIYRFDTKQLFDSIFRKFSSGFRWPIYFLIEKVISTLNFITGKMDYIKGIKIGRPKKSAMKTIVFSEQSFDFSEQNQIDNLLFSSFECRIYETKEEALKAYERSMKLYDFSKHFVNDIFFLYFLKPLILFLLSQPDTANYRDDSQANSYLHFYLERLLKSIFNFLIFSSYRFMLLTNFCRTESQQPLDRPVDYISYFQKIGELFMMKKENNTNLIVVSSIISECLFKATKKQIISLQCVRYILIMVHNTPFHDALLQKMINTAYENSCLLVKSDSSQVSLIQQWFLLLFKIGGKSQSQPPNSSFAQLLRNYQRSFISTLFNRQNMLNQPEVITIMIQYIKTMSENAIESQLAQFKDPSQKVLNKLTKPSLIHDFRQENKARAAQLLLDPYVFEIPQIATVLAAHLPSGFSSTNSELIQNAVELVLQHMLKENDRTNSNHLLDTDSDLHRTFFKELFGTIRKLPRDTAIRMIDALPLTAPHFILWKTNINLQPQGYEVKPLGIELVKLLNQILLNSTRKETEAKHIFMFMCNLVQSKEIVTFSLNDLEHFIDVLSTLARYLYFRPKIITLFNDINNLFYPLIQKGNFEYIYALVFSFQLFFSDNTDFFILILKSFFHNLDLPVEQATKMVDYMFSIMRYPYQIYNILILLLLTIKRFPKSITLNHFSLFMTILRDQMCFILSNINFLYLNKALDEFLKRLIDSLADDQKTTFMQIALDLTKYKNLVNGIRCVIISRIVNLGIKIPLNNFDFVKNPSNDIFYCQLSAVIGCGANVHSIPNEVVERSLISLRKGEGDHQINNGDVITRLTFIKMLPIAKIEISPYLEKDGAMNLLNFLKGIYSMKQFEKEIRQCLIWITKNSPTHSEAFIRSNLGIFNQKISILDEHKVRNFTTTVKVFNNKVQTVHLQIAFTLIDEFASTLPKERRIFVAHSFVNLTKYLHFVDYTQAGFTEFILSEYRDSLSYLHMFIHNVLTLYSDISFPYPHLIGKYVNKFLIKFKNETFHAIINHPFKAEMKDAYELILSNMITFDKSNDILHLFLSVVDSESPNFGMLSPYLFDVESNLSEESQYATDPHFAKVVTLQFQKLFNRKQDEYFSDNDSHLLNSVVKAYINVTKFDIQYHHIYTLSLFFGYASNVYTSLYLKFKNDIFYGRDMQLYIEMLNNIIKDIHKFTNYSSASVIISNLIKSIGRFPEEQKPLYDQLVNMLKSLLCLPSNNDNLENDDDFESCNVDFDFDSNSNSNNIINSENNIINSNSSVLFNGDPSLTSSISATSMINQKRFCALKCYYTLFKVNNEITNLELLPVFQSFPLVLSQAEPYPILLAFKFTLRLLNRKMMPDVVFSQILQHILQFQRLLDSPYTIPVGLLFKKVQEVFKKGIPEDLGEVFKVFIIEKIVNCKELDKVASILQLAPIFNDFIPFSVIYATVHRIALHSAENLIQKPQDIETHLNIIMNIFRVSQFIKIPEEIEEIFCTVSFKVLADYLNLIDTISNKFGSFDRVLILWMKYAKYMPEKLIDLASSKMKLKPVSKLCSNIGVLAVESVDQSVLLRQRIFIKEAFKIMIYSNVQKHNSQYMKIYITSIFSRPKLADEFGTHFFEFLDILKDSQDLPSNKKYEMILQLLSIYVKYTDHKNKVFHLIKFWNIIEDSHIQLTSNWQQIMFQLIVDISIIEQQKKFLEFVLSKYNNKTKYVLSISAISEFLTATTVSNSMKIIFLKFLPLLLPDITQLEVIEKMEQIIEKLPFFEVVDFKILIKLFLIIKSSDETRLFYTDELRSFLGGNEESRFLAFISAVPISIWTNKNLPFISFVLADECNDFNSISKSLLMLSDCFGPISAQFVIPLFSRILSEKTTPVIHKLLTSAMAVDENPSNYSEIVSAITTVFTNNVSNIHFSMNLLYKSIKLTNNKHLYHKVFDYHMENGTNAALYEVPDKLLLPNKMNDKIFSLLPTESSFEELAASAQFFLSNFNEASKVFNNTEQRQQQTQQQLQQQLFFDQKKDHQIFNRIMEISQDIVSKENTFHVLERYNHEDALLIPCLENARKSVLGSAVDQAKNNLSLSSIYNILYYKHHFHLSTYERQRVLLIEYLISIMSQKLKKETNKQVIHIPKIFTESVLFPIYSSFISSFINNLSSTSKEISAVGINSNDNFNNINSYNNNNNINNYNESINTIFSHEFRDFFTSVIGCNSHGFFSVPMSEIVDRAIEKASNEEQKWPGFCFSLLAASSSSTISPWIHRAALQGYLRLVRQGGSNSSGFFVYQANVARALTLFNVAVAHMDENLIRNSMELSTSMIDKETGSQMRYWGAQIVDLQFNSWFQQATQEINQSMSIQYTMFAHGNTSKPPNQAIEIIKYLGLIFNQILKIGKIHFEDGKKNFRDIYTSLEPSLKADEVMRQLQLINRRFPFEFDMRTQVYPKTKMFRINEDFVKITENAMFFTAITTISSHQLFVVERIESTDLMMTFSSSLYLLRHMLKFGYASRTRNAKLSVSLAIELGPNLIMYAFPADSLSFSQLSRKDIFFSNDCKPPPPQSDESNASQNFDGIGATENNDNLNTSESVEKKNGMIPNENNENNNLNVLNKVEEKNNEDNDKSNERNENNDQSKDNINKEDYVGESLLQKFANKYSVQNFLKIRKNLLSSFAAYSVIRNAFSLDQPTEGNLYLSLQTGEVPIVLNHFKVSAHYGLTATLIPQGLIEFFGPSFEREFELNFAAVSFTMNSYIDTFRAIVEMPIQVSLEHGKKQIENILAKRDIIDASLLDLAPPFSEGATAEDSVEWYRQLHEYVQRSKDFYQKTVLEVDAIQYVQEKVFSSSSTTNLTTAASPSVTTPNYDFPNQTDEADNNLTAEMGNENQTQDDDDFSWIAM